MGENGTSDDENKKSIGKGRRVRWPAGGREDRLHHGQYFTAIGLIMKTALEEERRVSGILSRARL